MKIFGTTAQLACALNTVSPKLGLIRNLRRAHRQFSDPLTITYSATTCDAGVFSDSFTHSVSGAGVNWQDAVLSTIGEGLERYASGVYDLSIMKHAAAADLQEDAQVVAPERFALFHDRQYDQVDFPFERFTNDTPVYWTEVVDLTSGMKVYCPSVFQYMPFSADVTKIAEQISTGFSLHGDWENAVLRGIFEAVERDAFMIAWANLLDLPKLSLDGALGEFVNSVVPHHLCVHLIDMTTDLRVPAVLGILVGRHDIGEVLLVSAASRFTLYEAAKKAVLELCQAVPYLRFLMEYDHDFESFKNVKTFADHSVLYLKRRDLWSVFDKWLNTPPSMKVRMEETSPIIDQIRSLCKLFRDRDYMLLARDATTVDLKQMGFSLFRIVCPELIHTNGTYGRYYLGGHRLYEAPSAMGYAVSNSFDTINHLPHPFP